MIWDIRINGDTIIMFVKNDMFAINKQSTCEVEETRNAYLKQAKTKRNSYE